MKKFLSICVAFAIVCLILAYYVLAFIVLSAALLYRIYGEVISFPRTRSRHWQEFHPELDGPLVAVSGDKKAKPRNSPWSSFWNTYFGWRKVAVLAPVDEQPFLVGYVDSEDTQVLCTKPVLKYSCVALLIGPEDVQFFGMGLDGIEIRLRLITVANRGWLPRKTPVY